MAYDAHDLAVMNRINRFITQANKDHPAETVAVRLEDAWSKNIKERENDSTNIIGRDADYYLAARKEIATTEYTATKAAYALLGQAAWLVYAGLKVGADLVGKPEWTRTDKDKPNAPVGGYVWMNRGVGDAFSDVGDSVADVKLHVQGD